jgi:hypothetical protein
MEAVPAAKPKAAPAAQARGAARPEAASVPRVRIGRIAAPEDVSGSEMEGDELDAEAGGLGQAASSPFEADARDFERKYEDADGAMLDDSQQQQSAFALSVFPTSARQRAQFAGDDEIMDDQDAADAADDAADLNASGASHARAQRGLLRLPEQLGMNAQRLQLTSRVVFGGRAVAADDSAHLAALSLDDAVAPLGGDDDDLNASQMHDLLPAPPVRGVYEAPVAKDLPDVLGPAAKPDFPRGFRAGWGSRGMLAVPDARGRVTIHRLRVTESEPAVLSDSVQLYMRVDKEHHRPEAPAPSRLKEVCDACIQGLDRIAGGSGADYTAFARSVWDLVRALWAAEFGDGNGPREEFARRQAFSQWLQDTLRPAVEEEARALPPAEHPLVFLTGNLVERACQAAIRQRDVRLATLIAQVDDEPELRRALQQQIEDEWLKFNVWDQIDPPLRATYSLLAGRFDRLM